MPTPHIGAAEGDFAENVIMPGDPRRAKLIAETFFDNPRLVTEVRGILGYTGTFEGKPVSVMASGMGMPSMTIYATELARFYGVKRIVRTGTAGGLVESLDLGDVIAASSAHTDSAMNTSRIPGVSLAHAPSFGLLRAAVDRAEAIGTRLTVGSVFTTDNFYLRRPGLNEALIANGTLAVEMEAAALYAVAAVEGIEALTIATISDHLMKAEELSAAERETTFRDMAELALAAVLS